MKAIVKFVIKFIHIIDCAAALVSIGTVLSFPICTWVTLGYFGMSNTEKLFTYVLILVSICYTIISCELNDRREKSLLDRW